MDTNSQKPSALTFNAEQAKAICNRANHLRRETPGLSIASSVLMAQREMQDGANKIMNRATELQRQTPGLNLGTAIGMAQREIQPPETEK